MSVTSVRVDFDLGPATDSAPAARDVDVRVRVRVHSGGAIEVLQTEATPAADAPPARETQAERRRRRLAACRAAGLALPSTPYGRLPHGMGRLAKAEGVKRQSFCADVLAALEDERNAGEMQLPASPWGPDDTHRQPLTSDTHRRPAS